TAAITAPRRSKMKTFTIENETNNRSEEHTSELQSRRDLVCRLLLEKTRRPFLASPLRAPPAATTAASTIALFGDPRSARIFFFKGGGPTHANPLSPPHALPS